MPLRTGAALGSASMPYPNEQRSKPVVSPSIVHQTDWLQYYTKDSQNGLQSKKRVDLGNPIPISRNHDLVGNVMECPHNWCHRPLGCLV